MKSFVLNYLYVYIYIYISVITTKIEATDIIQNFQLGMRYVINCRTLQNYCRIFVETPNVVIADEDTLSTHLSRANMSVVLFSWNGQYLPSCYLSSNSSMSYR